MEDLIGVKHKSNFEVNKVSATVSEQGSGNPAHETKQM